MTFLLSLFHLYGLLLGIGCMVGVTVTMRMSRFFKVIPVWVEDALPFLFLGALIGARLYHLLTDWQLYTHATFFDLLAVWRGGIGFLGGIGGGLLALAIWTKRQKRQSDGSGFLTRYFTYLDLLSFGVPLGQAVGRLGNYVNHELYGLPTSLPWGIMINGTRYHPLFLYEAVLNCALFLFLFTLARKHAFVLGKGQYVSVYLFGYGFIRFWLEFLRIETARWDGYMGIFSIAQWVTLGIMIVATIMFWVRRHAPKKEWDFSLD